MGSVADFAYELCHGRIWGVCPPATAPLLDAGTGPANLGRDARRSALAVCPPAVAHRAAAGGSVEAGRRDLNFAAASPTIPVRDDKGGRSRVVPAHPELVEAFRSISKGRPNHRVFLFSPRTAARWISQGIAAADLETVATAVSKGRAAQPAPQLCPPLATERPERQRGVRVAGSQ